MSCNDFNNFYLFSTFPETVVIRKMKWQIIRNTRTLNKVTAYIISTWTHSDLLHTKVSWRFPVLFYFYLYYFFTIFMYLSKPTNVILCGYSRVKIKMDKNQCRMLGAFYRFFSQVLFTFSSLFTLLWWFSGCWVSLFATYVSGKFKYHRSSTS